MFLGRGIELAGAALTRDPALRMVPDYDGAKTMIALKEFLLDLPGAGDESQAKEQYGYAAMVAKEFIV